MRGVTIEQAEADIKSAMGARVEWAQSSRTYQTELIARNPDELQAALDAAFDTAANAQVLSLHHRIFCSWTGIAFLTGPANARINVGLRRPASTHFREGGSVTITAAPGHRPALGNSVYVMSQGIVLQGLGFARQVLPEENSTGVSTAFLVSNELFPFEPIVHFEKCFFGRPEGFGSREPFDSPTPLSEVVPDRFAKGLSCQGLSDFISLKDCVFGELRVGAQLVARAVRAEACDFRRMSGDCMDLFGHTFATGYYASAWVSDTTFREAIDTWANRNNHIDAIQYSTPADIHLGYRLLLTDNIVHLAHSFAGDEGQGGGTQGFFGSANETLDNQFVIRRCIALTTAPHGFGYYSPRASRPSFVEKSVFTRAGRVPSAFAPDTKAQDFAIGITGSEPQGGSWLLVTDTVAKNLLTANSSKISSVDPRASGIVGNAERPESIFEGRHFERGGKSVNFLPGKFGYDLPDESGSKEAFVTNVWANFRTTGSHANAGLPPTSSIL
ncbi:MAG: hypothetical protein K2Y19_07555 [Afipia birgiae]|nr:hypothetical protein [Afipia birgiae]